MKAPGFWQPGGGWSGRAAARALLPAAAMFDLAGRVRRAVARPHRAGIPVLCVGNLVAGGSGKTPVVLALAAAATARGRAPHLLLRGYGGRLAGPVRVDPARHDAAAVGDEALLLARAAPTWVARDRAAGAAAAVAAGARLLILDDGFQNPSLAHDAGIVVVDAETAFGNGRVIPAGPLRETVARGLDRASAVVLMGAFERPVPAALAAARCPILRARLAPTAGAADLAGCRVFAFAGIGRPEKFFDMLRAAGAVLAGARAFADHHRYAAGDLAALTAEAAAAGARLVTTEKDMVRLPPAARAGVTAIPVAVAWQSPDAPDRLLAAAAAAPVTGERGR